MPVGTCYADRHDLATPADEAFLGVLPDARLTILQKVLESIYRENPPELEQPTAVRAADPSLSKKLRECSPLLDADAVTAWLETVPESAEWIVTYPFPTAETVLLTAGEAIQRFDRYRATGPALALSPEGTDVVDHPVDIVHLFEEDDAFSTAGRRETLTELLAESVANLGLARLAVATLQREAETEGSDHPLVTAAPNGTDRNAALERIAAVEERPTNPIAKIRRGMTPADGLVYAPEFTDRVSLRFVALDRGAVLEREKPGEKPLSDHLFSAFDGLERAVGEAIPSQQDVREFCVVPVHPWQYHHVLPDQYGDELSTGRLLPIRGYRRPATPLMNLRTVVPWSSQAAVDAPSHLKLPVTIRKTSIVRALEAQMVHNTPAVSALLEQVLDEESFESFGFLPALAAACYYPPSVPDEDREEQARHLSAFARMNPYAHPLSTDDTTPVTAASLLASPPGTDEPLVVSCIEHAAATRGTDVDTEVRHFLERYVETALPPQVVLTCKYGIELGSHLQNMVVLLDGDCLPSANLVRDLGDSRVFRHRLEEHGYSIDPYPDSDVVSAEPGETMRRTMVAFVQFNLAELVGTLALHTPVDEDVCWEVVQSYLRRTLDDLREDSDVPTAWIEQDESELFAENTVFVARISKALTGETSGRARSVTNPFARERRTRDHERADPSVETQ